MENFKNAFEWDIKQTPIYDAQGNVIKGYKEITRDDDDSTIAVMKNSFTPMTTAEFTDTVETISKNIGADIAGYEDWAVGKTMGKAHNVITAQLKITDALEIAGSKIEGFLTIGVGFDGGRSFYVGHTNEYLRCSNQWGRIITEMTSRLTKNNMLRVEDIVNSIQFYRDYEKKLYDSFKKFQEVKIDEKVIQECIARLVGLTSEERAMTPKERIEALSTQKLNKIDDIAAALRSECAELGDNAWGLFNGVTYYTTHVMNSRNQEMFGNLFGAKNTANQTVFDLCTELAQ